MSFSSCILLQPTELQVSYTQPCISGVLCPIHAWQPFSYSIRVGVIDLHSIVVGLQMDLRE